MYKEYGIYKIYLKVDKADVVVLDISDDGISYRSINNREVDSNLLVVSVNDIIDEYINRDVIYKVII